MEVECPVCGGEVGIGGFCFRCGRHIDALGDDELHDIVGGMAALTVVGVSLGVVRVYQGSKLWRDRKNKT